MQFIKQLFRTPYPYIFLLSYAGIWLIWDSIKLPFSNPTEVVSYLPSIQYNPTNNVLRFGLAVFVPALACLLYWWLARHHKAIQRRLAHSRWRLVIVSLLVAGGVLLALAMGIVQGSTNPANNPPDQYHTTYRYAQVDTFHEGETLGPAVSYQDPALKPYKDFVIVHGVAQDPVRTVLAFKLFGRSIGASRTMATILLLCTFVLFYGLLLVLFKGDLLRATLGLLVFAGLTLPPNIVPFLRDYIMGVQLPFRDIQTMLFLMAAILGFRYYLRQKTRLTAGLSAAIGFLAVAGFANSLDRALYIAVLSVVWLVMMFALCDRRSFWKPVLAWFGVGSLAGFAVLAIAFKGAFLDFLSFVATISKHKELLDGMVFARPGPEVALILLAMALFVGLGGYWVLQTFQKPLAKQHSWPAKFKTALGLTQHAIREHHTLILLAVTALLFMRNALGRALLDHFFYSVSWFYVFVVYFVLAYLYPLRKKFTFTAGFFVVISLVLTLAIYGGLVKKIDLAADTFPVHVKDEQLVRKDYLETANYLKQHLSGNETFATFTSEGIWYYLVDKPSPLRYPIIWYAFTKAERTQLANDVARNATIKFIVTNHNWTSTFDFIPNEQRFPELYDVLHRQYVPYVGFGDQTIWIRK